MEIITKFFEGSSTLNIIFFLLAVVSIILAILFYYNSLRIKKPVYNKKTFRLINKNISTIKNIEIKYNNHVVDNLSLTKIAIWNSGKESIRQSDIAKNDILRISSSEKNIIYDCEIIQHNHVNNIITTLNSEKTINISFDFLDFNEGFILNIYHSGNNSNDLIIAGTLIGAKRISQGIESEYFSKKIEIITSPIDKLAQHEKKVIQAFGWLLYLPLFIIVFPLFLLTLPLDYIFNKIMNKAPREFSFIDD